jgi:predicted dehydrogenase
MSRVKVAVIGAGFGARVVAPVFAATEGCEVVDAVSARDDAAIAALIARPDVDLVSVHSPPFLHAPHVRAALAAGKAVLCDKPFALNADEAAELVAAAADTGAIALCNFEFRYHPARALLRDLVAAGELGPVEHVQVLHTSAGSRVPLRRYGWLFDRALGGGWIGAWASHAVDQLRHCFGTEVVAVDARLRRAVPERPDADGVMHECTAEDGLTAALTLANLATVAIDSTFAATTTLAPRFTVFGADATAEVVADERIVVHRPGRDRETIDATAAEPAGDRHLAPMRRFAEVLRDAVTAGEIPPGAPTFADGLACDAVLDQLRAAPFADRY